MKRYVFLLLIIITLPAIAHTIDWYIDGNVYQTTTCESGDNITPPTPQYKRGYTFQEWSAFIPIEYLESTGTQWIDTGFYPNQDTGLKTKMQLNYSGNGPYGFGTSVKYEFFVWNGEAQFIYVSEHYTGRAIKGGDILEIDWDKNGIKYYINDIFQPEITARYASFNTQYPLYLFALKRENSSPYYVGGVKIYYFKLYNNNALVRDMIPVLDGEGVPCMYDKVGKQFYYNQGSGQFIAGPEVTE